MRELAALHDLLLDDAERCVAVIVARAHAHAVAETHEACPRFALVDDLDDAPFGNARPKRRHPTRLRAQ